MRGDLHPRLLLLLPTSTYRTEAFVEAARSVGVPLTVASELPSTFEGQEPENLLTLDFKNRERAVAQAEEFHRKIPITAVLGVDDDTTVLAAAISRATSGSSGEFSGRAGLRSLILRSITYGTRSTRPRSATRLS